MEALYYTLILIFVMIGNTTHQTNYDTQYIPEQKRPPRRIWTKVFVVMINVIGHQIDNHLININVKRQYTNRCYWTTMSPKHHTIKAKS